MNTYKYTYALSVHMRVVCAHACCAESTIQNAFCIPLVFHVPTKHTQSFVWWKKEISWNLHFRLKYGLFDGKTCILANSRHCFTRGTTTVWAMHTQQTGFKDALSLYVVFRKRTLWLVALLWKETCNWRLPMHLRHSVPEHLLQLQHMLQQVMLYIHKIAQRTPFYAAFTAT